MLVAEIGKYAVLILIPPAWLVGYRRWAAAVINALLFVMSVLWVAAFVPSALGYTPANTRSLGQICTAFGLVGWMACIAYAARILQREDTSSARNGQQGPRDADVRMRTGLTVGVMTIALAGLVPFSAELVAHALIIPFAIAMKLVEMLTVGVIK